MDNASIILTVLDRHLVQLALDAALPLPAVALLSIDAALLAALIGAMVHVARRADRRRTSADRTVDR
mgnify:CR=1 FL=1